MNILKKFKNYFQTPPTPFQYIVRKMEQHSELTENCYIKQYGYWSKYEYVFRKPIIMNMLLFNAKSIEQYKYKSIYKLEFIEFMNTFLDCRIHILKENEPKRIFILNDIYLINLTLQMGDEL